uniref:HDOD domain-containing protein n=1 Tax=Caenorhabditis tropicalis TaxID=1561998 RepID=A0A1I7UUS1_9PELO
MGSVRKREIVEFTGIRTYFFANLALYADFNEEILFNQPENANPVAAYIFGASDVKPSENEILDVLVPENADAEAIFTGMDACLALGFIPKFKALSLRQKSHDLSYALENGGLQRIARMSRLRKESGILWILIKILMAENDEKRFDSILDLCHLDLDFDALVLIKILGLETEENREEVEIIKGNVMERMGRKELVDLMKNEPKDEFTRLLTVYPIEESAKKLVAHLIDLFPSSDDNDVESEISKRRITCQLVFLLARAIASGNIHVAKQMNNWIPEGIRKEMFPGIQMSRVETALELVDLAMKNSSSIILPEMQILENTWSRRAIITILDTFRFAITQKIFGDDFHVDLKNIIGVVEKLENAIRNTQKSLENYKIVEESGSEEEFDVTQTPSEPESIPEILEKMAEKLRAMTPEQLEKKPAGLKIQVQ